MKWYYYFNRKDKENLLDSSRSDDNFFVCQSNEELRYGNFKNYTEFNKFFNTIQYDKKCFYEILISNQKRKPYFDIDIENNNVDDIKLIEELKNAILSELKDFGEKDQILVYSSNYKNKKSYHVVVNGYFLDNENCCSNFHKKIIEKMSQEFKEYVDASIYKSTQQFRILGSHKYKKDNTKIFRKDLSYNYFIPSNFFNEFGISNYNLSISLVGNIFGCKQLDGYEDKKEIKQYKGYSSSEDLDSVLEIFFKHFSPIDYQFNNYIEEDGKLLITIKRINPSHCEVCKRIHENENPFLAVSGFDRNIFYYCRRNENNGLFLGTLGPPEDFTDDEVEVADEEEDFKEKDIMKELQSIEIPKKKSTNQSIKDGFKYLQKRKNIGKGILSN